MPDEYEPGEWNDYAALPGGMQRFMCSYTGSDGRKKCIELVGIDPDQVLEDNCAELNGLTVDGILECYAEARKIERD